MKDRQDDVLDIVLSVSLKQTRSYKLEIEHKSLILAQIERWRHALHMQVGRQHREACFLGGEWRTGELYIGTYRVMGDN